MTLDPREPGADTSWATFRRQAPDLARAITARFHAHRHHILGTLRADGAPRLSGIEVEVADHGVRIGMMAGSQKLADVRRDPRVELHSAPLEAVLAAGDARLSGRVVALATPPPGHPDAGHFALLLERAVLVRVDADQLVVRSWAEAGGVREQRRR